MLGLPVGLIALVIVTILILSGIAQRVLDRMKMNDRTALILVLGMLVGGLLPDLPMTRSLAINVGGGLIPIGISIYLLLSAGTSKERWRTLFATVITTGVVYFVAAYLPTEPENMALDPVYTFALIAGITAYLFGRSRRGSFIAGVLGVVFNDLIYGIQLLRAGFEGQTTIGGAGIFDTVVLAGLIAVLLAELVGETREKLQGGPAKITKDRPQELKPPERNEEDEK
ncbi:MAG: hypothetical protein FD169_1330 [Bacillota bacterium]|nr:MAG: hypothetical protein FD169_1330 [Bacillota bacterium]MBS3950076.1 DUF1614 domain-containing protein [Peptococcaceae bacterium]